MKEILSEKTLERFKTIGEALFDIKVNNVDDAKKVIDEFYKFFESIDIPMHLAELGVKADKIEEMADHILANDSTETPWMYVKLNKEAIIRILEESM